MIEALNIDSAARQVLIPLINKREVAPQHFRLTFSDISIASKALPGQFVHILPRHGDGRDPFLRRAFSIVASDGKEFEVLFRVMGHGTRALSNIEVGEEVDLLGPLGQGFKTLSQTSILVGGGVGTPPMAMLASQKKFGQNITALIGARTGTEVLCEEDFTRYEVPIHIATDDGSRGHHGFVTDLLELNLSRQEPARTDGQNQNPMVYACGPLPMLRLVAQICARHEVLCQVSLEENMPCGIGVCNGCVVPIIGASDDYGNYRRICVDGPAVWAHEIQWGEMP